jgi:hypothetical protein
MWGHIYSWLVPRSDCDALVSYLEARSLMGRWMPEARELTDDAYLGETPWAVASTEFPDEWREIWPRHNTTPIQIMVYPTWLEYFWEGNVLDSSIEDGVPAMLPAPLLFEAGKLEWRPFEREWYADGTLIAQHRESGRDRHSALLVREDWLKKTLATNGWSLVVGWLGEKRLLEGGLTGGLEGGWIEINGIASLARSEWRFGTRRLDYQRPSA